MYVLILLYLQEINLRKEPKRNHECQTTWTWVNHNLSSFVFLIDTNRCCETDLILPVPDKTFGWRVIKTSKITHLHFTKMTTCSFLMSPFFHFSSRQAFLCQINFPILTKVIDYSKMCKHYWQKLNRRSQHLSSELCPCLKYNTVGRLFF